MLLAERFFQLWERIGAQGNPMPVYQDLVRRYSEPHRAYHTIGHIAMCLRELDESRFLCNWPNEVEAALWWHDAIYETRGAENELRSAQLAKRTLCASGVPEYNGLLVAIYINDTTHEQAPNTPDGRLVVDIDLAIFGQPPDIWNKSSEQIRTEYRFVPWFLYKKKRREILQGFLDRSYKQGIYYTPFFRDKYEAQARENLARSIAELK